MNIKHLIKLRDKRRYREEQNSAVVFGRKIIDEIEGHVQIKELITPEQATVADFKKITGMAHPEPLVAEVSLPPPTSLADKSFLIAFDNVRDPGNMGTMLRTALALGADGAFITKESVDPFNDKCIRASKGASFILPYQIGTHEDLLALMATRDAFVADLQGQNPSATAFKKPLILILGNEAEGPSRLVREKATALSIPMTKKIDSLNVAIAGAILLYAIGEKL